MNLLNEDQLFDSRVSNPGNFIVCPPPSVLGLTTLYYIAPEPHPEVDEDEVEFIEKVKDWFDKEQVGQENESDNTRSWDSQDRLEADVSFYECDLEMAEEMRQPSLETGM